MLMLATVVFFEPCGKQMSQPASTWFLAALGIALFIVITSVFLKGGSFNSMMSLGSEPAEYQELQARRDPPSISVEDPNADSLAPDAPYVLGGNSPSALHAGNGPLVDGGLNNVGPSDPFVHGTEPAQEEQAVVPFPGEEFDAW